jgi:hypothetical protein
MKIEKIPVEYEERYVSEDGKTWKTRWECEQYEELLADPTPLRELSFFDCKGNPIDIFQLKDIPVFSYLVLRQKIKSYSPKVVHAIIGASCSNDESFRLPTTEGVWYNDWSNAYNGAHGSNGWMQEPTINELQRKIKQCEEKIEKFQKMINGG